jgi:hypothetical protein
MEKTKLHVAAETALRPELRDGFNTLVEDYKRRCAGGAYETAISYTAASQSVAILSHSTYALRVPRHMSP